MWSISFLIRVESSRRKNAHHLRFALKLFIIPIKTTIPRDKRKSDPPREAAKISKDLYCLSKIFVWKSKVKMNLKIESVLKQLKINPILV
jgi:hypothetical protein